MIDTFGWFLLGVVGLAILQRWLHYEIQAILYLLTRRIDLALAIFSILFLPGVLLHELSHYVMAKLLKVPVGRLSIIPQPLSNGKLRLGYVETAPTDFFRDALIGTAPLITGSLFVAYAGLINLKFASYWSQINLGEISSARIVLSEAANQPDFWIWFYLIFVVSSTMFPSETDRRAWSPILLILAVLFGVILISGAGEWIWTNIGEYLISLVEILSLIFILSTIVHLFLLVPSWIIRVSLSRIFRLKVV